jgi:hypothetical protein
MLPLSQDSAFHDQVLQTGASNQYVISLVTSRDYRLSQIGTLALFSLMYAGRLAQSSPSAGSLT